MYSSFMVVSDPVMVKHVLKTHAYKYDKGVLAEILEPIMGKGACISMYLCIIFVCYIIYITSAGLIPPTH